MQPAFPSQVPGGYDPGMDDRETVYKRNRRIYAVIFGAVAVGLLSYGVVSGDWPTICGTALVAVINIAGAFYILRDGK